MELVDDLLTPRALVVAKDSEDIKELRAALELWGYKTYWARDGEAGYNVLDGEETIHAMITELNVHRIDGMRLLSVAKQRNPDICVIVIAGEADIELATEAMRQGAYDFQTKPLNLQKIRAVLDRGLSLQRLAIEVTDLHRRLDQRYGFPSLIGNSRGMVTVYNMIRQIAPTRATVLIQGETGTGKGLVAQTIHQNSPRRNAPFVTLNCASLAEGVIESELFGHERGAFTGAVQTHKGRFEIADGGTLFLDEVSEMSLATQAKLLRVLEDREFERVGGARPIKVDVRLIAASNRDLEQWVREGKFREDLFFRLKVVTIKLPPLRERKQDIPRLVEVFIHEFNIEHDKSITGISRGAMDLLMQYHWPGNVRELKNTIEGMVVLSASGRMLDVSDLPEHILGQVRAEVPDGDIHIRVGMTMEEIEKIAIEHTLRSVGYDKHKAAEILGIGLRTLYRKQKRYRLD
ncbi:MAG TPA: sigma-54 dependent transcriptional regulator [Alphaproteobacteria bacterium]|nr:sigma-54 dependent transcriptional regulator [Alphaproteobacteria bacterium]